MVDPTGTHRAQLLERLRAAGVLRTDRIADALLAVPRDLFMPPARRDDSYRDDAVPLAFAADGTAVSSLSQPTIVVIMLEMAGVRAGDHVLEIGTGSGYNAALLAHLAGEHGMVTSVEIEPTLAGRATRHLADLGSGRVSIVVADGHDGYEPDAPYDRVVVTTGPPDVAPAWRDQLVDGGRLVTPLVDEQSGVGTLVAFVKRNDALTKVDTTRCGFLPMRHAPRLGP